MKNLISIHREHFRVSPDDVVRLCLENKDVISGIEVCISHKKYDNTYLYSLAYLLKDTELVLQLHGPELCDVTKAHLDLYQSLSELYSKPLLVTCHPDTQSSSQRSIISSINSASGIMKILSKENYNLTFCIENLDSYEGFIRSVESDVEVILKNLLTDQMLFCWDIGHSVKEGSTTYSLNQFLLNRLTNIHLHDVNDGNNHLPYMYGGVDLKRTYSYLNKVRYNGSIVHEIGFQHLLEDKNVHGVIKRHIYEVRRAVSFIENISLVQ